MEDNNKSIGKKQIYINIVANIISYSSNLIISFVLTPFLINSLGKEIYSFYPVANTIVSYLSIITNSMNIMASRFVTISLVNNEKKEVNKYFTSVLISNVIISGVLLFPMLMIVVYVEKIFNVPLNTIVAVRTLFLLVFSSAIVNVLGTVYGIATFAKNRIDLRSLREIITALIRLVLFSVMYKFLPTSIIYVGIVALVVSIISLIIQFFYTKYLLPDVKVHLKYFSKKHTIELLKSSSWNMFFTLGNIFLVGMNIILANIFYGADASGELSIVNTVPSFINGVIAMLVGIFFPVITYKVAQNDRRGTVCELLKAEKFIGVCSSSVIIVFSALSTEFFSLWVPQEDSKYLFIISLITIIPHVIISFTWVLTNLNVALNQVKLPAIVTMCIGILNIILVTLFAKIIHMKLLSLPIISTFLQIIWAGLFLPMYASRKLGVARLTFLKPVISNILPMIFCFIMIYKIKCIFEITSWLVFFVVGIVFGIITIILMLLCTHGLTVFFTMRSVFNKIMNKG